MLSRLDPAHADTGTRWIVKLADFGLTRILPPPPTSTSPLTEYVSTRWYRAPEVLLRCPDYSLPLDVWAVGTVAAEVCTTRPLFPGRSEADQLVRIVHVLGSPEDGIRAPGGPWLKGLARAKALGIHWPKVRAHGIREALPSLDIEMVDLIKRMLTWDPRLRITAAESLQHPFFQSKTDRMLHGGATPQTPTPQPKLSEFANSKPAAPLNTFKVPRREEVFKEDPVATEGTSQGISAAPSVASTSALMRLDKNTAPYPPLPPLKDRMHKKSTSSISSDPIPNAILLSHKRSTSEVQARERPAPMQTSEVSSSLTGSSAAYPAHRMPPFYSDLSNALEMYTSVKMATISQSTPPGSKRGIASRKAMPEPAQLESDTTSAYVSSISSMPLAQHGQHDSESSMEAELNPEQMPEFTLTSVADPVKRASLLARKGPVSHTRVRSLADMTPPVTINQTMDSTARHPAIHSSNRIVEEDESRISTSDAQVGASTIAAKQALAKTTSSEHTIAGVATASTLSELQSPSLERRRLENVGIMSSAERQALDQLAGIPVMQRGRDEHGRRRENVAIETSPERQVLNQMAGVPVDITRGRDEHGRRQENIAVVGSPERKALDQLMAKTEEKQSDKGSVKSKSKIGLGHLFSSSGGLKHRPTKSNTEDGSTTSVIGNEGDVESSVGKKSSGSIKRKKSGRKSSHDKADPTSLDVKDSYWEGGYLSPDAAKESKSFYGVRRKGSKNKVSGNASSSAFSPGEETDGADRPKARKFDVLPRLSHNIRRRLSRHSLKSDTEEAQLVSSIVDENAQPGQSVENGEGSRGRDRRSRSSFGWDLRLWFNRSRGRSVGEATTDGEDLTEDQYEQRKADKRFILSTLTPHASDYESATGGVTTDGEDLADADDPSIPPHPPPFEQQQPYVKPVWKRSLTNLSKQLRPSPKKEAAKPNPALSSEAAIEARSRALGVDKAAMSFEDPSSYRHRNPSVPAVILSSPSTEATMEDRPPPAIPAFLANSVTDVSSVSERTHLSDKKAKHQSLEPLSAAYAHSLTQDDTSSVASSAMMPFELETCAIQDPATRGRSNTIDDPLHAAQDITAAVSQPVIQPSPTTKRRSFWTRSNKLESSSSSSNVLVDAKTGNVKQAMGDVPPRPPTKSPRRPMAGDERAMRRQTTDDTSVTSSTSSYLARRGRRGQDESGRAHPSTDMPRPGPPRERSVGSNLRQAMDRLFRNKSALPVDRRTEQPIPLGVPSEVLGTSGGSVSSTTATPTRSAQPDTLNRRKNKPT